MHPQAVDYWTIQYFNPRLNPQIDPTSALYHHFIARSRNLLIVNHGCQIILLNNSMKKYIDKEMTERYNTAIPNDN